MRGGAIAQARYFALLLIGATLVSAFTPARRAKQNGIFMDLTDKLVAEKFAAFQNEQEPALVREALEAIEAAEQGVPAGDTEARKRGLALWLFFFAALDRNIDPQWDPKEVPVTGVIPPPSHGIAYPSGVSPSAISDPVARAEYEQALKASKDHAERYRVQLLLRRIDERATAAVERLLGEKYAGSREDWQEFEEILASAQMSDVRKQRLRSFMPKPTVNRSK
jgi:hypothetical protein